MDSSIYDFYLFSFVDNSVNLECTGNAPFELSQKSKIEQSVSDCIAPHIDTLKFLIESYGSVEISANCRLNAVWQVSEIRFVFNKSFFKIWGLDND